MSVAYVFPGQGTQHPGMCAALARRFPAAREVLEEVDEALGEPLSRLMAEGPPERLRLTENAQPAILAHEVAWLRVLERERPDLRASVAAGHSLGEYAALVAAGVLGLSSAVRAVRSRGRAMQRAVAPGRGGMLAVVGLEHQDALALCDSVEGLVEVAAINCPGQVVVAGEIPALERYRVAALAGGARVARRLEVSAPFHCSMLEPAARELEAVLAGIPFGRPSFPVLHDVDAAPASGARATRRKLVAQVTSPVLWESCVRAMAESGVTRFLELGPGWTLAGLVRRTVRGARVWSLDRAGVLEELPDAGA